MLPHMSACNCMFLWSWGTIWLHDSAANKGRLFARNHCVAKSLLCELSGTEVVQKWGSKMRETDDERHIPMHHSKLVSLAGLARVQTAHTRVGHPLRLNPQAEQWRRPGSLAQYPPPERAHAR